MSRLTPGPTQSPTADCPRPTARFRLLSAVLVLIGLAVPLSAQPRPAADPPKKRRVFIPIEDLDVILSGDRRGVLLERAEYLKMRTLALKNEAARPRPPAPLVLKEVVYTARPSGDHLLIDATVRFHQFARGWQSLRLPLRSVSVERAVLDGRPARVGRLRFLRGKQTITGLELFHDATGDATLELGLSTPLVALGSDKVAAFGLIPAATATLKVELPAGKHLLIDGLAVGRPAAVDQPAVYTLPMGGRAEVRLAVTDRQTERTGDALVFASTGFGINVAPGEVTWQAVTTLEVFGQPLDRVIATVPGSLEVTDVASSGLQEWTLADDPDDATLTRITLDYRQPFSGSRQIIFRGVKNTPVGTAWDVPRLRLAGVTSHVGVVLLQYPPGVRLQTLATTGARRGVGAVALNNAPAGTEAMRFEVWREDFGLSFSTETKRQELEAAITTVLEITEAGLVLGSVATIESRFSPLFQVDFTVPTGWKITQVKVAGKPAPWQRLPEADGRQPLRVRFAKALPEGKEIQVELIANLDLPEKPQSVQLGRTVALPEVALVPPGGQGQADGSSLLVEGTYLIKAADVYDVIADNLVGLDNTGVRVTGQRLGYEYQNLQISGTLKIVRRPYRLSAETLSFARLDPETLSAHLETHLDIQGGGTRLVVISLPEQAGSDLQFRLLRSPFRIVEQTETLVAGRRHFTLKFDEFIRGRLSLAVDVTMTRAQALGPGGKQWLPPTLRVEGADRESGYVAIEGADDQEIATDIDQGQGKSELTPVDPVDLPQASYRPRERIVAAFRYHVAGYRIALEETRFDHGTIPAAICKTCSMTSIVSRTGELHHRAEFILVAAGVQSLIVDLGGSDDAVAPTLWAVTIDGKPVKAHQKGSDEKRFTVELPTGRRADVDLVLQLFYKSQVDPLIGKGRLAQAPPRIELVSGTGQETTTLPVLEQHWEFHHPAETAVVASDGRFAPVADLDSVSLLGRMQESFQFVSPTALLSRAVLLAVVAGALVVLTLAFRRRRYQGLAAATLVLVAIGFVAGVVFQTRAYTGADATSAKVAQTSPASAAWGLAEGDEEAFEMDDRAAVTGGRRVDDLKSMRDSGMGGGMGGGGGMRGGGEAASDEGLAQTESPTGAKSDVAAPRAPSPAKKPVPSPARPPQITQSGARPGTPKGPVTRQPRPGSGADRPGPPRPADSPPAFKAVGPNADPNAEPTAGYTAQIVRPGQNRDGAGTPLYSRTGSQGAVLSLAFGITPPAGSRARNFRFVGDDAAAMLQIEYQDLTTQLTGRWFWIVTIVALSWFLRSRPLVERAIGAIVGLVVPLALVTILPVSWHIHLDGLFLGTLLAIGVWLAVWIVPLLQPFWQWCRTRRPGWLARAGGWLLALAAASSAVSIAQAQPAAKPASGKFVPPLWSDRLPGEVVPFDPSGDPLKASRVLIPQQEFLRLWNLAYPERQVLPPAPRPGVVSEASWEARVVDGTEGVAARVSVQGRLVLYSFRDGQILLPIPLGSVALGGARLDGQPAPIVTGSGKGAVPLAVVVPARGQHLLTLDFDVPLKQTGTAGEFSIPLSAVPVGRFHFNLPDKGLLVRVNGTTTRHRRRTVDGNETIDIPVDAGGLLRVAWQPRQSLAGADGLVQLQSYTSVQIADDGLRRRGSYRFNVRQGGLPEVAFLLPPAVRVQRVLGADVGGWDLVEADDERRLRVFFRRRVDDVTAVSLELFQELKVGGAATEVKLDAVRVVGITRDSGLLALEVGQQFSTRVTTASQLKQVDLSKHKRPAFATPRPAPAGSTRVVRPPRQVFRYITRPFALTLQVSRRTPESVAVARHAARLDRRKVRLSTRVRWTLTKAAWSGVTLALPFDYLPVGVDATAMADWYVHETDDGERRLTIEFDSPRTGVVDVVVDGLLPRVPDVEELELTLPRPLGISRMTSQLAIWTDEAHSANVTSHTDWATIDPRSLDPELKKQDSRRVEWAFQSARTAPEPIGLEIKRATPALSAAVVTVVTVSDTSIDYTLAMAWQITQAAADEFVFVTPFLLKDRLQFRESLVREVRSSEIAGADGQQLIRWSVTLNEPVRGQFFLQAQATLPPPTAGDQDAIVVAPGVSFVQADPADPARDKPLAIQERYVILINQARRQLLRKETPGVKQVREDELDEVKVRIDRDLFSQATVMLRLATGAVMPTWTVAKSTTEQGATAVVNLEELVTVLAVDGSWRTRATYTVQNRSHQFLAVQLPEQAKLLSVKIITVKFGSRPSRAVVSDAAREAGVVLVALPNTSKGDRSFDVELILAGKLGRDLASGFQLFNDTRSVPVPHVIGPPETDKTPAPFQVEFGMPVRRTSWAVHLPEDLDVEVVEGDGTNLSLTQSQRQELYRRQAVLDEVKGLVNVIEGEASGKAKFNAASNLKELGGALANYRDLSELSQLGREDDGQAEFAEMNRRLQGKVRDALEKLELDQRRKTVTVIDNSDSMSGKRELIDELSQKLQIARNNDRLYIENYAQNQQAADYESRLERAKEFGFKVRQPSSPDPTATKPGSKKAPGKGKPGGGKQATAQLREKRRRQSLAQALTLNKSLEDQKKKELTKDLQVDTELAADSPNRLAQQAAQNAPLSGLMQQGEGRERNSRNAWARENSINEGGRGIGMDGKESYGKNGSGGLSVTFDIPIDGQTLYFAKTQQGAPRLELAMRPRETVELGLNLLWALAWLAVGAAVIVACRHPETTALLRRHLAKGLIVIGVLGCLVLPNLLLWIPFLMFLAGAMMQAVHQAMATE